VDERPALWVGHVVLATHDLRRSFDFCRALGLRLLREAADDDAIVELEMRGCTHLVLVLDPNATIDGRIAARSCTRSTSRPSETTTNCSECSTRSARAQGARQC
jgi:catechol 2,3-dioxygenase-like lactoylglutathione lyase family enzyme